MSTQAVFGKRKEPHTIIIAQGETVRHLTVRPWMAALAGALFASIAVGYLLATAYLMLRDDILNAAVARQARMQYAYEDRIAALRSQVDRITSYRLLDQQIMETKVAELLTRQSMLAERSGRLAPLLDKAKTSGIPPASAELDPARVPVPTTIEDHDGAPRTLFRSQAGTSAGLQEAALPSTRNETDNLNGALPTLTRLGRSLGLLEVDQLNQLTALADSAREKRRKIVQDARDAGLSIEVNTPTDTGTGGPFIPADGKTFEDAFEHGLETLNRELQALDEVRGAIRSFPIANPAPGQAITSGFGKRKDPIIGRTAFHAGVDMSTPTGTPILAAGAGTVISAGRNGGYGKMVEIRHAGGLTTRYAHLSRISVKKGQEVAAGMVIGAAGSTGRSTGPHLHYEVRRGKTAINPMTYLKAGTRLNRYL